MNIEVTRDNVKILEQSETPHENEYKITTCYFTFDEFTDSFQVKRAIFTILSTEEMYETDIINNQCDIPSEVLEHEYETVKLGVYGYNIGDNDELLNRFSPSYAEIVVPTGSYKEGALSPEPITPSQYDLYSQALQEGLQEVDDKLDEVVETVDGKLEEVDDKLEEVDTTVNNKMTEVDNKLDEVDDKITEVDGKITEVDTAITETNNLNLDVSDKVDGDVTVTLTKKDASTKSVVISDGTSLQFRWQGTSLGVKTDDMEDYIYVDLQGIQGVPGPQGEPFRIKKTYSSVAEMNADFDNMQYGDYVMIASTVEVEDNAKLYTRGESQWIFITDFSGATGIKGETGATPNIQIGTVTSGSTPDVTRTGTNENPVLNFVLQPGPQGQPGQTGATGNGIASITKTSTSGLVDTYTITYTSGNTTTFNVTNGNGIDHISLTSQSGATKVYTIYFTDGNTTTFTVEDGEVTQEVFDEELERANMIYNAMPKVSGEGTDITLNNTAKCPVYDIGLSPSELEQESTTGKNLVNIATTTDTVSNNYYKDVDLGFTFTSDMVDKIMSFSFDAEISSLTTSSALMYASTGYGTSTFSKNWVYKNYSSVSTGKYSIKLENGLVTEEMVGKNLFVRFLGFSSPSTATYTISNIQLEQGSTATSYEEYTGGQPSPNPQYPQEIHTVSGDNSVKIQNKNLLNPSILENGNIDTNTGLPSGTTGDFVRTNDYISVISSQNYAFQYELKVSGITGQIVVYEYDTNKSFIKFDVISGYSGSIALSSTTEYIKLRFKSSSSQTADINYTQVEYRSNVTSYEPYTYQTYPISLGDLEYCKIGNYEDEFYKATESDTGLTAGKWYLKKNIGKKIFTGANEENWTYTATDTSGVVRMMSNILNGIAIGSSAEGIVSALYCDKYLAKSPNQTYLKNVGMSIASNGNVEVYDENYNATSSPSLYKTWLSTNNVLLYYPTTTPTYTLLNDTLQTQLDNLAKAISYQDQTNVSQTNAGLPFVIKLSAIRDLSGIFELIQE